MKERLGVILAAGKSTRTERLGVRQKALAVVRWEGCELPAVAHQVRLLEKHVDDVCVIVGWMKRNVKRTLDAYDVSCKSMVDSKIQGIGMVWKQVFGRYGKKYEKLVSVNCDDLHREVYLSNLDDVGLSVMKTDNRFLVENKTCYETNGAYVLDVLGKNPDRREAVMWIGTGIYVLNMASLRDCHFSIGEDGECSPDSIIKQLVQKGEKFKTYVVDSWMDVGNPNVLRKHLLGYGYRMHE